MKDNQCYTVMIAGLASAGMEEYVKNHLVELMKRSRKESGCVLSPL